MAAKFLRSVNGKKRSERNTEIGKESGLENIKNENGRIVLQWKRYSIFFESFLGQLPFNANIFDRVGC